MSKGKYKRKKQQAKNHTQQQIAPVGIVEGEIIPPNQQAETSDTRYPERNKEKEQVMGFRELAKRGNLTDWLIAFFTFILAGSSIYQFIVMRSQLTQMNNANRISVGNLQLAQKTLSISQGPEVYLTRITLSDLRPQQKAAIQVELKNFGHLEAQGFGIAAMVDVRSGDPLPSVDIDTPTFERGGVTLDPDIPNISKFYSRNVLDGGQVKNLKLAIDNLYIYGVVKYENPLDEGTIVYMVFCSKYDPTRQDGLFVGCNSAPELTMNGKPLARTHEPQKIP